jgi:lytic murein transglycosylase
MRSIGIGLATLALILAASSAGSALAQGCGNDSSGFNAWLEGFKRDAAGMGISQRTIASALSGARYSSATIRLDRNQKVFKQSFEQFAGRMIPPRMGRARSMLAKHAGLFSRIEQQFGVPKEIVVAIWGLETDFGAVTNTKVSVVSAVATLAYDCRRSDFFTGQLVDALRVIERGDLTAAQMVGGLHGEIGQTQFLPSSYYAFAVDFDGNGRRDLVRSTADVLASTANYLRGHGWRPGQGWTPGSGNFNVIKQWNKSDIYSRTVAEFARRLAEG